MKTTSKNLMNQWPLRAFLLIPFVFACFALLSQAQAVSPPPDGGYPAGNTAEGQDSLLSLTTGTYNTGVGFFSLMSNDVGSYNTAIGAGALFLNTGEQNTATGTGALFSNTTGLNNIANGTFTLFSNTTGPGNTAVGGEALFSNTTGNGNTAVGGGALFNNTTGALNTVIGTGALIANVTGNANTAIGQATLSQCTGSGNTALGGGSGFAVTTASNVICIGSIGADVDNSCFIGNIRGHTTLFNDAISVVIDSEGQLGTLSSSRRFKKEIQPMDKASEAILALKPVTFHYKSDKTNRCEFGLIAEDVAEVNPNLVVHDQTGEIYTVRYEAVNAMLLNEFLKEHRKVEEQGAMIARQQKQIEALTTGLQKVSAQLEASKPAPQVVKNF